MGGDEANSMYPKRYMYCTCICTQQSFGGEQVFFSFLHSMKGPRTTVNKLLYFFVNYLFFLLCCLFQY